MTRRSSWLLFLAAAAAMAVWLVFLAVTAYRY